MLPKQYYKSTIRFGLRLLIAIAAVTGVCVSSCTSVPTTEDLSGAGPAATTTEPQIPAGLPGTIRFVEKSAFEIDDTTTACKDEILVKGSLNDKTIGLMIVGERKSRVYTWDGIVSFDGLRFPVAMRCTFSQGNDDRLISLSAFYLSDGTSIEAVSLYSRSLVTSMPWPALAATSSGRPASIVALGDQDIRLPSDQLAIIGNDDQHIRIDNSQGKSIAEIQGMRFRIEGGLDKEQVTSAKLLIAGCKVIQNLAAKFETRKF